MSQPSLDATRVHSLMRRPLTGPFRPTRESGLWWFHCLNREVFHRKLPAVRIYFHSDGDSWGWYIAPDRITLAREYETKQQFVAVLGHEMVHHWQAHNGFQNQCHGPSFMRWARRFRQHGIVLTDHGDVHMG